MIRTSQNRMYILKIKILTETNYKQHWVDFWIIKQTAEEIKIENNIIKKKGKRKKITNFTIILIFIIHVWYEKASIFPSQMQRKHNFRIISLTCVSCIHINHIDRNTYIYSVWCTMSYTAVVNVRLYQIFNHLRRQHSKIRGLVLVFGQ